MDAASLVKVTSADKGVRILAFNRPQKRNALSGDLISVFLEQLASASKDPDVRVIVITGEGSFFSAGADLNDIAVLDASTARSTRYLEDLCRGMSAVRKPVIAAVNGPALGGGFEVALMSDLILVAKSAYFALPEVKRGLIPGAGGTQRLTAAVGKFRAMKTILMGQAISSSEAVATGLACDQCEDEDILPMAIDIATSMASNAPVATELAKEAICRADSLCRDDEFERSLYYVTFGTDEKYRGVNEFLNTKSAAKSKIQ